MLPTGTVTFLFTDIQGSTPLWEREPEKMAAALQIHHTTLRKAIEAQGGMVFQIVGDSFEAVFSTASRGLRAAVDSQRFLQASPWNELGPLDVRMGLHTGEAQLDPTEDGYASSHTFNRVARIMSAAHGGQILLSQESADLVRRTLPEGVTLLDLGKHNLKGMRQPEQIFQVVAPGLPSEFPAITAALPRPRSSLQKEVLSRAQIEHPGASFNFLDGPVYSTALTAQEQQDFLQLLRFVRALQSDNPVYEPAFHNLLNLYVLNGSRLGLLRSIDRRLRGLAEGQGSLLLVSGNSGIGKTSLVMAFQERIRQLGAEHIAARCFELERTDFALWRSVAHSAAEITGISIETMLAPIGAGIEARSSQQLKQAFTDWLNKCSALKRLVIVLDDLHWADADSLDVLNHLADQPFLASILFIVAYRSEDVQNRQPLDAYLPQLQPNRASEIIHLDPLKIDDIDRLVTAYHGACSPQLAQYLLERANGNPHFTVELLNDLIAQNLLSQDQKGFWLPPEKSVPAPHVLKQLITQRLNRLGPQVEQMLSIAAVVGERWDLKIVERLSGMPEDELLAGLESSIRENIILIEDDKAEIYRFSHGLMREVLYSAQLARRRKRLHEQTAAFYEQQERSDIYSIAYHYFEAENWEKALEYNVKAGEQATRRFAMNSALQWYQQALSAAENALSPAAQLAIYERLGRIYLALDQREEAEIVYSRMRDLANRNGDLVAEGHALVNLANVRMRLYQFDLAEKAAAEALKIGEQTGDVRLLTDAHARLGGLLIVRGELDQARLHTEQVLQNAELLGDSGALLDMLRMSAYQSLWTGQYIEAEGYATRALKLAQKSADPLTIAGALQNLSFVQIETGQYHQAYQNIRATLEAVEVSGSYHHQEPRFLNMMGYLYLELGDAQSALAWDQKALEAIQDNQVQVLEMRRYSLLNRATDFLHLGRLDEAHETIAQFEDIKEGAEFVRFRYFNRYQLLMCEMLLFQNVFEQAIELAQEARLLAQSKGVLKNVAKSHWLEGRALAGMLRFDEAADSLEKAVVIVDSIQHGSLRWKIRLSLAEVLAAAGKSPQEATRQARELIDQTLRSLSGSPLQNTFQSSTWVK